MLGSVSHQHTGSPQRGYPDRIWNMTNPLQHERTNRIWILGNIIQQSDIYTTRKVGSEQWVELACVNLIVSLDSVHRLVLGGKWHHSIIRMLYTCRLNKSYRRVTLNRWDQIRIGMKQGNFYCVLFIVLVTLICNIYTPSVFCYDKHKKIFDIQFFVEATWDGVTANNDTRRIMTGCFVLKKRIFRSQNGTILIK